MVIIKSRSVFLSAVLLFINSLQEMGCTKYCSKQEIKYFYHSRKFPHYLFTLELESRSADWFLSRSLREDERW